MHMKRKKFGFLTTTDRGSPTKKAGKSRKTQLVFMKGNMCFLKRKRKDFWPKLIGGTPRKRLENSETRRIFWLKRIGGTLEKCPENHACGPCVHKGKITVLGLENLTTATFMFFEIFHTSIL